MQMHYRFAASFGTLSKKGTGEDDKLPLNGYAIWILPGVPGGARGEGSYHQHAKHKGTVCPRSVDPTLYSK